MKRNLGYILCIRKPPQPVAYYNFGSKLMRLQANISHYEVDVTWSIFQATGLCSIFLVAPTWPVWSYKLTYCSCCKICCWLQLMPNHGAALNFMLWVGPAVIKVLMHLGIGFCEGCRTSLYMAERYSLRLGFYRAS